MGEEEGEGGEAAHLCHARGWCWGVTAAGLPGASCWGPDSDRLTAALAPTNNKGTHVVGRIPRHTCDMARPSLCTHTPAYATREGRPP
jgi:hypothetical protein